MNKILSFFISGLLLSCSMKENQPYTVYYEVTRPCFSPYPLQITYQTADEFKTIYTSAVYWVQSVALPPDKEALLWVKTCKQTDACKNDYFCTRALDTYQPWLTARIWYGNQYVSDEDPQVVITSFSPKHKDELTDDFIGLKSRLNASKQNKMPSD